MAHQQTHVLVVARDDPYLFGTVRAKFADVSTVEVLRDRRRGERRVRGGRPPEGERRCCERRSFAAGVQLDRFGWVIVPRRAVDG